MPFGKGKKNGNDFSKLNRSTWVKKRGNKKRSSFHLQSYKWNAFYNVHSSQGNLGCCTKPVFIGGVSCYRISGKSFKNLKYIYSQIRHQFHIDSQQNKKHTFKFYFIFN